MQKAASDIAEKGADMGKKAFIITGIMVAAAVLVGGFIKQASDKEYVS